MLVRLLSLFILLGPLRLATIAAQYSLPTQQVLDQFTLDSWHNPAIGLDKDALLQAVAETQGEDHFKAQFLLAAYIVQYENLEDAVVAFTECTEFGEAINVDDRALDLVDFYIAEIYVLRGEAIIGKNILDRLISKIPIDNPLYWRSCLRRLEIFPNEENINELEQEIDLKAKKVLSELDYARIVLAFGTQIAQKKSLVYLTSRVNFFEKISSPSVQLKYSRFCVILLRSQYKHQEAQKFLSLGKKAYSKLDNPSIESKLDNLTLLSSECRLREDYNCAYNLAVDACLIAKIDTSLEFSFSSSSVSENATINLLTGLATTHLYLGDSGVDKAFGITERLAQLISEKASTLNDWNIASHYYSKRNIAVNRLMQIADYMYQQNKDISYLNRALAFLDHSRAATVYDRAFRHKSIKNGGELADLLIADEALIEQGEFVKEHQISSSIQNEIIKLTKKRSEINRQILAGFPEYNKLRNDINLNFIDEWQKRLKDIQATVLYYFYNPNYSFRVLINSDTVCFHPLHNPILHPTNLPELMRSYPSCIARSPLMEDLEGGECLADAYALSQLLLGGEELRSLLKDRVIITGNGIFDAFPFQALPLDSLGLDYFGLRHRLTYTASLRLLSLMEEQEVRPKHAAVLGFAPAFSGLNNEPFLAQQRQLGGLLTANREELESIAKLVKGRYFYGEEATKQQFFAEVADYGLIHLATHAKADANDGRESIFVLSDGSGGFQAIYAEELRQLRLNTNLVSLSACETGLGSEHLTEGTIGFTHAFAAAGAKGIVASHWAVEDHSAAEIMRLFYTYLQQGKAKDEALRLAQNDFRQRHGSTYRDHPYYWAPFSFYGDAQPLQLEKTGAIPRKIWLLLPIVGGLILWYRRRAGRGRLAA